MDNIEQLEKEIKISISSIDKESCFPVIKKIIKPVGEIERYSKIFLNKKEVFTLNMEELTAEKIRALATRKTIELANSPTFRDVLDLHVLDKKRLLDRVRKNNSCLKKKIEAIKTKKYFKNLEKFMRIKLKDVYISKEEREQIIDDKLDITEKEAGLLVKKVQEILNEVIQNSNK